MQNDYSEKDNFYFGHVRNDIISEIKKNLDKKDFENKKVLEVGCGTGITGKEIIKLYNVSEYVGVEYVSEIAKIANENIHKCHSGKVEDILEKELKNEKFDVVLFFDVLEHLYDPWSVLDQTLQKLKPNGLIIASIPNISFYEVVWRILFDKFEYNPNGGILDSTHIRWFTKHTILKMFKETKIIHIKNKIVDFQRWYSKLILFFPKLFFPKLFTIQYIVIARKE